jgi:hypothetical protein
MWENIQWVRDDNWIAEAIKDGSCIAVTDGLYMKALYRHILKWQGTVVGRSVKVHAAIEEDWLDLWRFI